VAATARASFAVYNTVEEVHALRDAIRTAQSFFGVGGAA
jgi:cysteine desulfurase/selenocysteine lyase